MEVESVSDLLAIIAKALLWGAGYCGVYKLYDALLAKAGWKKEE